MPVPCPLSSASAFFRAFWGTWLYPRLIGIPKAAEGLFTADFLEVKDTERFGLLNRLVRPPTWKKKR